MVAAVVEGKTARRPREKTFSVGIKATAHPVMALVGLDKDISGIQSVSMHLLTRRLEMGKGVALEVLERILISCVITKRTEDMN